MPNDTTRQNKTTTEIPITAAAITAAVIEAARVSVTQAGTFSLEEHLDGGANV
jgi:hypothetical protein